MERVILNTIVDYSKVIRKSYNTSEISNKSRLIKTLRWNIDLVIFSMRAN